nr:6K1 [Daphne virus Y]
AKNVENQKFEKIIAFIALVMMIFDTQRSDCVYKALTKIRSLTTICGETVKYQ